jgi:hypothetical protein
VVRFTDVDPEKAEGMLARIDESGGGPPGVAMAGLQVFMDAEQGTAVVLQLFESAEDMRAAEETFDSMDPSDTPGTRASVDRTERKLDVSS